MRMIVVFISVSLCILRSELSAQIFKSPIVDSSTYENMTIGEVEITDSSTNVKVLYTKKRSGREPWIEFSSKLFLYSTKYNEVYKVRRMGKGLFLDSKYSVTGEKGRVDTFTLIFEKIKDGIEYFSIIKKDLIKEYTGWFGIRISNPEVYDPKKFWTEERLISYWNENGLDEIEGIYERNRLLNGRVKFGIQKVGNDYNIYLLNPMKGVDERRKWLSGEYIGRIKRTAKEGVFIGTFKSFDKQYSYDDIYFTFQESSFIVSTSRYANELGGEYLKLGPIVSKEIVKQSLVTGTGFIVSNNGLIATNYHVVEKSKKIKIKFSNETGSQISEAKILFTDVKNDIALLKVESNELSSLPPIPYIFSSKVELGEKVFTIGFPISDIMGENVKVSDGIVSSLTGAGDDKKYLQISVPIQPGNSGGPLFNSDGMLIGITTARLNQDAVQTKVENVNYAIKSEFLSNLLSYIPAYKAPENASSLKGLQFKEQVKILKSFVCLIEVSN